jgi:hypothetical protein
MCVACALNGNCVVKRGLSIRPAISIAADSSATKILFNFTTVQLLDYGIDIVAS